MTEATRVNLGCGPSPTVGWKNYDNSFSIRLAQAPLLEKILTRLGFIHEANVELIEFARKNDIVIAQAGLGGAVRATRTGLEAPRFLDWSGLLAVERADYEGAGAASGFA